MDSIFENSFIITEEIFLQIAKNPHGKKGRNSLRKWYVMNGAFLVLSIFGLILTSFTKQFDLMFIFIVVIPLFLYNLFFRINFVFKKQFRRYLQYIGTDTWKTTVIFSDDICIIEGLVKTIFMYSDIKNITFNEKNIYLWRNNNFIFRIPKNSFTKGNYNDFLPFIKEKTNFAK